MTIGGWNAHGEGAISIEQWLRQTRRDDNRRFEDLRKQITGKSILDFDCGAGGFLLLAKDIAESVEGIELEKRLTTHFYTNAINVVQDIDQLKTGKKFDVITLFLTRLITCVIREES